MKNNFKISQVVRKNISLFLLLNFIFTIISFTFPQEKCDGKCSLDIDSHQCFEMKEMTCCDMMGMNDIRNSTNCGMKITENSCDYKISVFDNFTFLVPKVLDAKIILTEIYIINQNVEQEVSNNFYFKQNIIPNISSPIYIAVSSFLI